MDRFKNFLKKTIREYLDNVKTINEASFFSFQTSDILTDKYIMDFIRKEDYAEELLGNYIKINDLDPDDEDEIRSSSDFRYFVKDFLLEILSDAMENIYDKIDYHDNKITLYRAITVNDEWLNHLVKQGKRLGIFWSWDENGAETHWGDYTKNNVAVIEAEIEEKYIDWKTTFELNMHPYYTEEKEIRLFKNTPIKIKSITINDEEIDISELKNKTFYS